MKRIAVLITLRLENVKGDMEAKRQEEMKFVLAWQASGILENFFLRGTKNGAFLIFKDIEEAEVKKLIENLPFFPYMDSVEYLSLEKHF